MLLLPRLRKILEMKRIAALTLLTISLSAVSAYPQARIDTRISTAMSLQPAGTQILCLVTFADKGSNGLLKSFEPSRLVTQRALARRAHVLPPGSLVDDSDLPLDDSYVAEVAATGAIVRHRLKWFNGVSVLATAAQIGQIRAVSHVDAIEFVGRFNKDVTVERFVPAARMHPMQKPGSATAIDYGESAVALDQIDVPAVHKTGNYAQGVIIGVFDNGFRRLSHTVFDSLRPRILATHDFVDHKTSVVPNDPDPGFGSHGVYTLSTIGGYKPGSLVGPAFGASFILARTENDSSETPVEEDNWAAAIQWAESLGVQVTSTSLGYLTFDAPYTSLTWQDMDGKTALITRAAEMAVRKGVVVVNSAGNNRFNADHNTLNAPADGDSVIAAGSVNSSGDRSGFSSVGPTTSDPPAIKPDVMAPGESIWIASAEDDTSYGRNQGTSFSCPFTAGVAALILHAHPDATPAEVMLWLKATASNFYAPNNLMGWGIIDAAAAIAYSNQPLPTNLELLPSYPNPFNNSTTLEYQLPEPSRVTVRVYDVLGRLVRSFTPIDQDQSPGKVTWDGTDGRGISVASGVYYFRVDAVGVSGQARRKVEGVVLVK